MATIGKSNLVGAVDVSEIRSLPRHRKGRSPQLRVANSIHLQVLLKPQF